MKKITRHCDPSFPFPGDMNWLIFHEKRSMATGESTRSRRELRRPLPSLITPHTFSQSLCTIPISAAIFSNNSLYPRSHRCLGGETAKTTTDTGTHSFHGPDSKGLGLSPTLPA